MTAGARSGGLDAVRVLALVAVVAGHVWLSIRPVHVALFAWHVPVFFFLTGLLWRSARSFGGEARRRLATLGLPYVAWMAVLLVASAIATGSVDPAQSGWIASGLGAVHRPFHTAWFLTSLLFTALLYRLVSPLPVRLQVAIAVVAAAVGTVGGSALAHTPLSIGTAVFCLPFVVAGAAARTVLPRVRHRAATGAALVGAGYAPLLLGASPVDLKGGDVGTPVVGYAIAIVIPAGLVLLAEALFERLPARASRIATALALPAVVVLLAHSATLWLLDTPTTGGPLDFALCLLIPWALGLLIVRTPLAPVLAGTARIGTRRTPSAAASPGST